MHETIGWIGAVLYITAYFLLSIRKLQADRITYQLLNVFGGLFLIVNSLHKSDYPSIFTNAVWAAIGLFAIYYNRSK